MADWVTAVDQMQRKISELESEVEFLQRDNLVKAKLHGELLLEKMELAKRPVVYVRVVGGHRRESEGGYPLLYIPEEFAIYSDQSQFEPYTGEQKS